MADKSSKKPAPKKNPVKNPGTTKGCDGFLLPEVCDITCADDFHKKLTIFLQDNKDASLDGSNVKKITTPAVQILLAADESLEGGLKIKSPSEVMESVFEDLGFIEKLNEWKG